MEITHLNRDNKKRIASRFTIYCLSVILGFSIIFSSPLIWLVNAVDAVDNESGTYNTNVVTENGHIPSTWAIDEILEANKHGLTKPDLLKDFRSNITREEFCGIVVKLYEILSGKAAEEYIPSPFSDTQNTDVLKAHKLGIVQGVGNGKFNPHNTITRQEICVVTLRTIKTAIPESASYISTIISKNVGMLSFSDADLISDWAIEGVTFLSSIGIMKGIGSNRIDPLGTTTREQAIVLCKRTLEFFLNNPQVIGNNYDNDINNDANPADKDNLNSEEEKSIETKELAISVGNNVVFMGETVTEVLDKLGEPSRKDLSKYGFEWYVYNKDYSEYIQVGISDGKVVGIYSNAVKFEFHDEILNKSFDVNDTRKQVSDCYGKTMEYIQKDYTRFFINENMNTSLHLIGNNYVSFYFDKFNDDKISSVMIIDKETEENLKDFYISPTPEMIESYERQIFDLTNASRVRFGKNPLNWDETGVKTARGHSKDMADRSFFDHINPDGKDPFDRMKDNGITYSAAGENIAAGYAWAIDAHETLMNSSGHRKNILGDYEKLSSGVYFGGKYQIYATIIFYTPASW